MVLLKCPDTVSRASYDYHVSLGVSLTLPKHATTKTWHKVLLSKLRNDLKAQDMNAFHLYFTHILHQSYFRYQYFKHISVNKIKKYVKLM